MNPDGVSGRSLLMPAGAPFRIPLILDGHTRSSSRAVRLLPHDWRDGHGAVRAVVDAQDAAGHRDELWAGSAAFRTRRAIRPPARGVAQWAGAPGSRSHPAPGRWELRIDKGPARPACGCARAIWVEPELTVEGGLATPPAPTWMPASGHGPRFSVLTPVHNPPMPRCCARRRRIGAAAQTYGDWELCLVDDGSTDPDVIAALRRYADDHARIHLHRHDTAQGIAARHQRRALEMATGDYIALLDHDDWLTEDALAHVAARIAAEPDLDMVYSDEDILLDGRQVWVHLKPEWSPDTLRTNGYTCHLGVYRRSLVAEIGGFRTEFNGSQDVDMILRLTRAQRPGRPYPPASSITGALTPARQPAATPSRTPTSPPATRSRHI